MINLNSLLKTFGLFVLIFSALFMFSSTENIEQRLGKWFIDSSSRWFSWTMPQVAINVEHDRDPARYRTDEVWISPISKAVLQDIIAKSNREGKSYSITNEASLLFRIGTFPKTSLVFLMSLILATPLTWKKKGKALLIALLLFMLYFYFFLYFKVIYHIAVSRIGIYEFDGASLEVIAFVTSTFCNFGFSLSFALFIWLFTCIDFNRFLTKFNDSVQGMDPERSLKKTKPKTQKQVRKRKE